MEWSDTVLTSIAASVLSKYRRTLYEMQTIQPDVNENRVNLPKSAA